MTSLKTSIKTITYLSDTGCLEIQGASLPCIDVDTAKNILNMTIEQERQKVAPELTAAFENFMDMHSPQAVSAGMAYDGRNPGDDGDIDRILKTI
ncbi:hypothetical protein AW118_27245 [Escherichia coli]|nr:hypothetical protein AW073_27380 [Escherichia coli]OTE53300.1 hypothetical protein AW118_27245 [Escherichia coli]PDV42041.1 hypothetical protein BER14_27310 [Escherichia coli]